MRATISLIKKKFTKYEPALLYWAIGCGIWHFITIRFLPVPSQLFDGTEGWADWVSGTAGCAVFGWAWLSIPRIVSVSSYVKTTQWMDTLGYMTAFNIAAALCTGFTAATLGEKYWLIVGAYGWAAFKCLKEWATLNGNRPIS